MHQRKEGKEGFPTLRNWLLREKKANKGLPEAREDLQESQGREEGYQGRKDPEEEVPKGGRKKEE